MQPRGSEMKPAPFVCSSVVMAVLALSACGTGTAGPGSGSHPNTAYAVQRAFPALSFDTPVNIQNAGDGSGRLFVIEQPGRIQVFDSNNPTSKTEFLNIESIVNDSGYEEGLLGLAFAPDFAARRYYFVYYTLIESSSRKSRVSRFRADAANPNATEPGSRVDVITVDQPYANHNGGEIAFGPDGFLYIGLGDGGSANDPAGNGQNRATLLGSILRIDVGALPYTVPPGNPFANNTQGYAEEIWAWGLRNPWRFSFDPVTDRLWVGDVGQNAWEEIDIVEGGKNYGWRIMEGNVCRPPTSGCATAGLELPVWVYAHNGSASVTGGHVYRGAAVAALVGKYVYADFVTGELWALSVAGSADNELLDATGLGISSFGVDEAGELYFCAFDGHIYEIVEK